MNKQLLLLVVAALSTQLAQAGFKDLLSSVKQAASQVKSIVQTPKEYKKDAAPSDPKFTPVSMEVMNKSGKDAWVATKVGSRFVDKDGKRITPVPAGARVPFTPDISQGYEIYVWNTEPASTSARPTSHYKINANETGYVNITPDGTLSIQRGPGEGRLEKNESGISTKKNVKSLTPIND